MDLENSFLLAATEGRKMNLGIGNASTLAKAVNAFGVLMQKASGATVFELKNLHRSEMNRLVFTLKDTAKTDPTLRSALDKVFGGKDERHLPQGTTIMFETFVKGITYFDYTLAGE